MVKALTALFALALVSTAVAEIPPGDNVLGLYTMTDSGWESRFVSSTIQSFTVAVCLSGCTFESGVGGYEFGVVQAGDGALLGSFQLYGGISCTLGMELDRIAVVTSYPLVPNDAGLIILADIGCVALGGDARFFLHPIVGTQSVEGAMLVVSATDFNDRATAVPASGSHDVACYTVYGDPSSDSRAATWSEVRRLYR